MTSAPDETAAASREPTDPAVTEQRQRRAAQSTAASPGRLGSGRPVTFAFGGDVHFESPIRERLDASPAAVLAPIAPVLSRSDIAMVNLETAITDRGTRASKAFTFRGAGHRLRSAASRRGGRRQRGQQPRHGLRAGRAARHAGRRAQRAACRWSAAGRNEKRAYAPFRRTVNGQRVAIIGATQVLDDSLIEAWTARPHKPGLASAKREERLARAVREARRTSDTVVVFLHWGLELASCPTTDQKRLAARLVAAGADVVVGSHAHVLLGAGRMRKALVAYGLGNFVFYAFREITSQTGVLEVTVTGRRIDGYRWIPARISSGIPRPLGGSERRAALRRWNGLRACTGLRQ